MRIIHVIANIALRYGRIGKLIGIELFNASAILKDVIEPIDKRIKAA